MLRSEAYVKTGEESRNASPQLLEQTRGKSLHYLSLYPQSGTPTSSDTASSRL